MATLRNRRKLAAVPRKTPENTRNSQSQNALNPGMAEEYITQVSEEIEKRVTKKLSQEFSRTESPNLGALSKLDEFLLNPQVRTCSVDVPGTSRKNNPENRESTVDRSLNDPYPEVVFSACHTNKLNDSDQEETHHSSIFSTHIFFFKKMARHMRKKIIRTDHLTFFTKTFLACVAQYDANSMKLGAICVKKMADSKPVFE